MDGDEVANGRDPLNGSDDIAVTITPQLSCGKDYNSIRNNHRMSWYNGMRQVVNGIDANGNIFEWGADAFDNYYTSYVPYASPPTDSGYIDIVRSVNGFTALKNNGTLSYWGPYSISDLPTDSGYTKIFGGDGFFAGLKNDGSISTWGSNTSGTVTPPTDSGYVDVYIGKYSATAIKNDGTISYFYSTSANNIIPPSSTTGYQQIVLSHDNGYVLPEAFAGLKNDGTIVVWGNIDNSPSNIHLGPTDAGYIKIIASNSSFAALNEDGSVVSWGNASGGPVGPDGYVDIYASECAFAAIRADGSISSWGDASCGGFGAPTDSGYVDIYASGDGFAAIKADGSISGWWGNDYTNFIPSSPPIDSGYVDIYTIDEQFIAVKASGTIFRWGRSNSSIPFSSSPVGSIGSGYIQVLGTSPSCN